MGPCCFKSQGYELDKTIPRSISMIPVKNMFKFAVKLGGGSFGTVRLAYRLDSKVPVAVKIISKENLKNHLNVIRREVEILTSIDHPNIIKLLDVYEDECRLYLIMEYCAGGELFTKITKLGSLSEKESLLIMRKILMPINHLHSKSIVHRDLKPQHILFESNSESSEIKIIDFGLSNKLINPLDRLYSQVGTIYYSSPEVLKGDYDNKCDL